MPDHPIWYVCDAALTKHVADHLSAIHEAGVHLVSTDGASPTSPGLVLFDDFTPSVLRLVEDRSRLASSRVLAVAVGSRPVRPDQAWQLLAAGAADVVFWDPSRNGANAIRARFERWSEVDRIVVSALVRDAAVGESAAWLRVLRESVELARFTDSPALITGPTGSGKEVIARLVHALDARAGKRQLVVLDCTTIVPELAGSEFFGHERGAFTSAVSARDGAFAQANGGTLFLDEVGELPLALQAELLRVVQEGTYKRVGSNTWQRTEFRLICATNRDLGREIVEDRFRRDFYYRIASWPIRLPALEERRQDILPLVHRFLCDVFGDEPPSLDPGVRELLLTREYPGNVRDLRQLVLQIARRHVGPGPITVGDIPEAERPGSSGVRSDWRDDGFRDAIGMAVERGVGLKEIANAAAEAAVDLALAREDGSVGRASRRLGITERAMQLRRARRRSAAS